MANDRAPDDLRAAYAQALLMLRTGRAATAEGQLRSMAAKHPGEMNCQWLLGAALLDQNKITESVAVLEPLVGSVPGFADARVDLARAYRAAGNPERAREELRGVLATAPHHHRAWLAYGDALVDLEQHADAAVAFDRARLTDPERARIDKATEALAADDRKGAEDLFRGIVQRDASHAAALSGLAALALLADRPIDAERLLRHALKQSPHLPLVHRGLAPALVALGRLEEAQLSSRHLVKIEPRSPQSWVTTASVATRLMRQEDALEAYERAAALKPDGVGLRMAVGHVQKTLGLRSDSEASYKRALQIDPGHADAYWSLADLKNYEFSDAEIESMQRLLVTDKRGHLNEAQLHFALGSAYERRKLYPRAFEHYAKGNALRHMDTPFDLEFFERRCARIRAFFDAPFFAARSGNGDPRPDPIFIVGLPRSGSTLIEQILASHSRVDGTMELPNILNIVSQFDDMAEGRDAYPESVGSAPPAVFSALGSRYLAEIAPLRHGRARFIDKLPNNFSHVGLIHTILPNATIIDARRHPMDSCFSTFKQHFAEGQTFSYDLTNLGRYYRSYLTLMDHWDTVLPGKVLHVQYEEMVRNPEVVIRRLLAHCGLEFESACLDFHATQRAVRTPSAEQVRQPIYTSGVGYWRRFAEELAPLRASLGDCLERFADPN